ncbi:MAG: CoA activase [Candidatus Schekmanbacteria bacterium]|nr:CoA activase [Candidatus Schekmanbacteria bacterium]
MAEANTTYWLGIDVGSVSGKMALLDEQGRVWQTQYQRLKGDPVSMVIKQLGTILQQIDSRQIRGAAITGTGGELIGKLLNIPVINEIVAQSKATACFHPQVRTIVEIGGEDSKLILLDERGAIQDFAMNAMCAAGTGSFLDQQANRLGLSIENEFGALAVKSKNPPRIAGRCSVFAKSDMIHLQQVATPDYDIVAGLCYAMARSFKSNLGRGKEFIKPIAFQGGVAANQGMIKALLDILDLTPEELIIPQHFACMGAIGSALTLWEAQKTQIFDLNKASEILQNYQQQPNQSQSVSIPLGNFQPQFLEAQVLPITGAAKVPAYLGIDIGSISTNVVVIDEQRRLLSKRYLMTAGRPLEAVRQGLSEVGDEIGARVEIKGVGTTGSGRYLIGDFVGADIVKNEITAQARAAAAIDPKVDTIFEIGGQDSKYVSMENGIVVDFEMNKVCAAGTGSFLEEQAEKLGISIKEEFGGLALASSSPSPLGERCTVFMETDLHHHQQRGAAKENLVAGLSYSIVHNYLNRVVGKRKIGNQIFFQGGVATNQGVVAAFESVTGKKIIVPPHHEVTGAIGVAIIAQEKSDGSPSKFKGFDLGRREYQLESFECRSCPNHCEIKKVIVQNEAPLFYGSRCEKFEKGKKKSVKSNPIDLFAEREQFLLKDYGQKVVQPKFKIGIPRCLFAHEFFPFWRAFFHELGMEVILSSRTNKQIIQESLEHVCSETCFPIKIAHGHVLELLEKELDYIFLPSMISLDCKDSKRGVNCPYVQTIPYTLQGAIDFKKSKVKLLQPVIQANHGIQHMEQCLLELGKQLGCPARAVRCAWRKAGEAQGEFTANIQRRGREILASLAPDETPVVIISRPYNGCDQGLNLELPQRLAELGFLPIPLDFLPLENDPRLRDWPNMYWRYGQRILKAADFIREHPLLAAVYLTNFGCGPDSFIGHFFNKRMAGKPYLQLEVDEHSADAGAVTRCEAFKDSLESIKEKNWHPEKEIRGEFLLPKNTPHKLFIPAMADHCYALAAALTRHGVQAEVMPESNQESIRWGRRYTSGRECYPCILTTGDMIKKTKDSDFDPARSAFFMPSGNGPCRFGQYNMFHRMVLDDLGFEQVPIYAPAQTASFYEDLGLVGNDFVHHLWQGVLAIDFLDQLSREIRPYELTPGQTDRVYKECLQKVQAAILEDKTWETIPQLKQALLAVPHKKGKRPILGIVGEIFVRSNPFSNNNLIREIEALGGEVWLPPLREWFLYLAYVGKRHNRLGRNFRALMHTQMTERFLQKEEQRFAKCFQDVLRNNHEPSINHTMEYCRPYLDPSFEGEAPLSIGKSVDFINKGVAGIINTMPFTCMPGNIVTAVLKRVRRDFRQIPCLDLAFDGVEQSNTKIRLEAFIHQALQYQLKKAEA